MSQQKRITPAGNRGESDNQVGTGSSTILPENRAYPQKIKLSDNAEAVIAGYAVDLMLDRLQFWQLPDSVQELYVYAFEAGRESLRDRIDRLEWERDLYYWLSSNRGKNATDFYSHQTSELWRAAVTA